MGDHTDDMTAKERRRYRVDHGLCPECGEEAAPYYLCTEHRKNHAVHRMLNRMAERGIIKKEKIGREVFFSRPPDWVGPSVKDFDWGKMMFEMDADDNRLKPRLGRRPIDLDETLIGIFQDAGRRLEMHEILVAWGKLRSQRKTQSLAGDMTAIIQAQRRRDARNAKRAAAAQRNSERLPA